MSLVVPLVASFKIRFKETVLFKANVVAFTLPKLNCGLPPFASLLQALITSVNTISINIFAFIFLLFVSNLVTISQQFIVQANIINNIFSLTDNGFDNLANEVFQFQYQHNKVYAKWCDLLKVNSQWSIVNSENREPRTQNTELNFPFLPISFFKSHTVTTTLFEPQQIFESSGTTQTINSKHLVKDISIYQQSFIKAFELFYGDITDWCIIGLLPSYLERNNSSLVMMADELIKLSKHPDSGFYLNEFDL